MVGRSDVGSAISLNSACFNAARIVGPSIGGLIIGRYGIAPAFVLNALGFAIAIAMMLTLRARGLPQPRSGQGVGQEILIGHPLRVAHAARCCWRSGSCFMVSLCVFNFTVYVPLVVRTVLGLGAEGFGFLMAALGVGAVSGALIARHPRGPPAAARADVRGGRAGLRRAHRSRAGARVLARGGDAVHHRLLRHHRGGRPATPRCSSRPPTRCAGG